MRLAPFIETHLEPIVAQWETFAATLLPAAQGMSSLALRDHAASILGAVAKDLRTVQTREAQHAKSEGRAPLVSGAPETAAQTHALLRARDGFDINQLVAEYRALRASVLRLWIDADPLDPNGVEDVVRFNEAIDQAIAESVQRFHQQIERSRNLLLGTLGHDMRSPLNTITATASFLAALDAGEPVSTAAGRLQRSAASLRLLLDDLVDFNRANLGLRMRIAPTPGDLVRPVADEVDQQRGAHPRREISLTVEGNTSGHWDGARVQQMLRNLVANAVKHGAPGMPIEVGLTGWPDEVRLAVTNSGPPLTTADLERLADPLSPAREASDRADPDSLGLGIFIVSEIARGHGGRLDVSSEGERTCFAVRLPRR